MAMKFGSERLKRGLAVGGLLLAAGMAGLAPSPAQARVFVSLGLPLPVVAAPVYAPPLVYAPPPVAYAAPPVIYPAPLAYPAPVYGAAYVGPYWPYWHRHWR
jgi:hypothetical protein